MWRLINTQILHMKCLKKVLFGLPIHFTMTVAYKNIVYGEEECEESYFTFVFCHDYINYFYFHKL